MWQIRAQSRVFNVISTCIHERKTRDISLNMHVYSTYCVTWASHLQVVLNKNPHINHNFHFFKFQMKILLQICILNTSNQSTKKTQWNWTRNLAILNSFSKICDTKNMQSLKYLYRVVNVSLQYKFHRQNTEYNNFVCLLISLMPFK